MQLQPLDASLQLSINCSLLVLNENYTVLALALDRCIFSVGKAFYLLLVDVENNFGYKSKV